MSTKFDYKPFLDEFLDGLKIIGKKAGGDVEWLGKSLKDVSDNASALLKDLETSTNPKERAAILHALETLIPDRKVFILARIEATAGIHGKEVLDSALTIAGKLLVAVAKALIPVL